MPGSAFFAGFFLVLAGLCGGGWLSRLDLGRPRSGSMALTATHHCYKNFRPEEGAPRDGTTPPARQLGTAIDLATSPEPVRQSQVSADLFFAERAARRTIGFRFSQRFVETRNRQPEVGVIAAVSRLIDPIGHDCQSSGQVDQFIDYRNW